MKKKLSLLLILSIFLGGCAKERPACQIAATTLPVYEFTGALCQGTPLTVGRLITQSVSCLHDYSLNVEQVKQAEAAEVIVISGAGLEEFMEDMLSPSKVIDASTGISLLESDGHHHHEEGSHEDHEEHDPHIWLDPENARLMAENICGGLSEKYPQYAPHFQNNLEPLLRRLDELEHYGKETLRSLSCRELITFHDGFSYFAEGFDLRILAAVEEESGSEASAKDLIALIRTLRDHSLPAIFVEKNGSTSAAKIIAAETGASVAVLDMAMAGESYFDSMYANINAVKEALK